MATRRQDKPHDVSNRFAQSAESFSGFWQLRLFDRWMLRDGGHEITVGLREQRMLAVLALYGPRSRRHVAGVLWPDSTDAHAVGNLRAAVWRVEHTIPGILLRDRTRLALATDVCLDVQEFLLCVRRVVGPDEGNDKRELEHALAILQRGDLLPGWYDDWVLYERTRLAQLRLRALESLAERLIALDDTKGALEAALAAVAIEPLRESAQRALIRVHIADGNHLDAIREYRSFRTRLAAEMDVTPSEQLESLIHPLLVPRHRRVPAAAVGRVASA
jgi:DNA-binding SARP family transcriptional activator